MNLRRRYFRTRPSWSVLALLVLGVGFLVWGIVVSGTSGHSERVATTRVFVHHLQAIDYAKLAAKVAGVILILAAAVRHANQLETLDDLIDRTRPEGDLSSPRATGNTTAQNAAMREI